jgi:predicted Zn-dependent protease with MMP-like domain
VALPPSVMAGPQHEPFEDLVEQALDELPDWARRLLVNVAIVVEDEPTSEQLTSDGYGPDDTLYGLYEGVPATIYGSDWAQVPNKISLFRLPLEADFADPDDLREEVRRTVLHELAHHAGIDDDRLEELDLH